MESRANPQSIGELNSGAHLVLLYESEDEFREALVPFMRQGLERGQKLVFLYKDHTPETIKEYLGKASVDTAAAVEKGALDLRTSETLYGIPGILEPQKMLGALKAETDRALREGYTGLRLAGEVTWQAENPETVDQYHYHSDMNELLPHIECLTLCLYDARRAHPDAVRRILMTHPFVLKGDALIANPFYVEPGIIREGESTAQEGLRWMECITDLQHLMGTERAEERDFVATVLEAEAALVVVLDSDGRIELFNRACEELTGYSASEVIGKPIFDILILPEEREQVQHVFDSLMIGDFPSHFENRWMTRAGGTRLIAWSNARLLDDAGRVQHIIGTGLDVTELRELEHAQRESAQRFEVVAQLATDFIYEYDPVANKITWFGDIDSYLGFPPGEGPRSYEAWMNLIHPEDRERVMAKLAKTREKGKPFMDEHRIVKPDGTILYWLGRAAATFDEMGRPVKFVGAVRDITARKLVEEDRMRSESRFRSLFENAPFGILIHRLGTILFANHALLELFGYEEMSQVEGSPVFQYLTPESAEQVGDILRRRLAGEDVPNEYETTGLTSTGRNVPLYIVVVPLDLDDGPALMVYMLDITERKAYEEALRNKAEELKNFLTIAAHELRHPITILKGYARVIEDFPENEMVRANMPEILGNLDKAANRLDHLVDELLDVSRIEQGKFALDKEPLQVAEVFERAVGEMKVEGIDNPITWLVAKGAESVLADPDKLDRLLLILLENAANFSPTGAPIEMDAAVPQSGEMTFSVSDRGSGVPEEVRERVFDRFYQVAEVEYHSVPGLGMGLYIAHQIVDAHGGRIWNEPREGGGTVFRFALPMA